MSLSWGALAGAFLGPFMYGLFWKGTTKASVYASFIVGIAIPVVNLFVPFATPLAAGAISIIASLIVVPVVSLITPKMNKDAIERIFQCYDKKETAPVAGALTEEAK
jgi:SSS family solute:Na+ symporter